MKEVEKIISTRVADNGCVEYKVKWVGLPESKATWKSLQHIIQYSSRVHSLFKEVPRDYPLCYSLIPNNYNNRNKSIKESYSPKDNSKRSVIRNTNTIGECVGNINNFKYNKEVSNNKDECTEENDKPKLRIEKEATNNSKVKRCITYKKDKEKNTISKASRNRVNNKEDAKVYELNEDIDKMRRDSDKTESEQCEEIKQQETFKPRDKHPILMQNGNNSNIIVKRKKLNNGNAIEIKKKDCKRERKDTRKRKNRKLNYKCSNASLLNKDKHSSTISYDINNVNINASDDSLNKFNSNKKEDNSGKGIIERDIKVCNIKEENIKQELAINKDLAIKGEVVIVTDYQEDEVDLNEVVAHLSKPIKLFKETNMKFSNYQAVRNRLLPLIHKDNNSTNIIESNIKEVQEQLLETYNPLKKIPNTRLKSSNKGRFHFNKLQRIAKKLMKKEELIIQKMLNGHKKLDQTSVENELSLQKESNMKEQFERLKVQKAMALQGELNVQEVVIIEEELTQQERLTKQEGLTAQKQIIRKEDDVGVREPSKNRVYRTLIQKLIEANNETTINTRSAAEHN